MNSNEKKSKLLKEPFGTASAKLRKIILFRLLQETQKDICYRCKHKIENINELSIEHKTSWMSAEDPINSFYNLENISFSHLKCNILSEQRATQVERYGETKEKYICIEKGKHYTKPFRVRIYKDKKLIDLGYKTTIQEAITVRDNFMKENRTTEV